MEFRAFPGSDKDLIVVNQTSHFINVELLENKDLFRFTGTEQTMGFMKR